MSHALTADVLSHYVADRKLKTTLVVLAGMADAHRRASVKFDRLAEMCLLHPRVLLAKLSMAEGLGWITIEKSWESPAAPATYHITITPVKYWAAPAGRKD